MTPVTTGSPYIFVYDGALDSANCDLINTWVANSDMATNVAYVTANAWEHATSAGSVSDSNVRSIIASYRNELANLANTAFSKSLHPESTMLLYWRNGNSMPLHADALDSANIAPEHMPPLNSSIFMREVTSITFTNDGYTGGEVEIQVAPRQANTEVYTVTPKKGTVVMFDSHCFFSVNVATSGANSMITLPAYFTTNSSAMEVIA